MLLPGHVLVFRTPRFAIAFEFSGFNLGGRKKNCTYKFGAGVALGPASQQIANLGPDVAREIQGVDAEGLTAVDTSAMVILMIGIGSIVLFGMAEAVRGPRRLTWRESAPGRLPAN